MPIDPVDVRAALICAFSLPDAATAEDLRGAVDKLDPAGALAALQVLADLLNLQDEGAES